VKRLGVALLTFACALVVARSASAVTHQATIGNYYYEDDSQRDQTKIVVRQGDQITFTVRAQAVPGHTVDVDALNIHSPNLNLGDTFTTPPLSKVSPPNGFYLYCRPHEDRGHHVQLIVLAATAPTPTPGPRRTATPPHIARVAPRTPTPATPSPAPTATLTPVGLGTAAPGVMQRPFPTNPNSLNALTGRKTATNVPWTRSLWWLVIASVALVGAAAYAWSRAVTAPQAPPPPPRKRKPPAKPKR